MLRGRVLQVCFQSGRLGAGTELIAAALKKEGFPTPENEIDDACRYLEGKGLVSIKEVEGAIMGISRRISYITPADIDALEGTLKVEGIEL